jgi:hypothetical protein
VREGEPVSDEPSEVERVRPGGRPRRREREATGQKVEPVPPGPVHAAKTKQARGYRWETAAPGNLLAIRHGAATQKVFAPLARQLAAGLAKACPDLGDVRYAASVTRWAEAEAQESLLVFELDRVVEAEGVTSERAEQVQRSLDRVRGRSARLRADLGLTPRGHIELVAGRASAEHTLVDLDEIRRKGRRALEARRAVDEAERVRDDDARVRDVGDGA